MNVMTLAKDLGVLNEGQFNPQEINIENNAFRLWVAIIENDLGFSLKAMILDKSNDTQETIVFDDSNELDEQTISDIETFIDRFTTVKASLVGQTL